MNKAHDVRSIDLQKHMRCKSVQGTTAREGLQQEEHEAHETREHVRQKTRKARENVKHEIYRAREHVGHVIYQTP